MEENGVLFFAKCLMFFSKSKSIFPLATINVHRHQLIYPPLKNVSYVNRDANNPDRFKCMTLAFRACNVPRIYPHKITSSVRQGSAPNGTQQFSL